MLLDTCIVIDVLRGHQAALDFVTGLPDRPCLSVITATEIFAGVRGVKERQRIDGLLESYKLLDIGLDIAKCAGDFVRLYGPSHSVDPIDALIAATAKTHGLPLATLNIKHFPMFEKLRRPYQP